MLAWIWNLVERVARKCFADTHLYLLVAKSVLVINPTLFSYLAFGAFWQLDELTTHVGPKGSVSQENRRYGGRGFFLPSVAMVHWYIFVGCGRRHATILFFASLCK
jgi:hypothetical protein